MFTPLAYNKPSVNNEVDRNNSTVSSRADIIGGYRMDNPNSNSAFFENCTDFTAAIQVVVTDLVFNTFIRRDNNAFQISSGNRWFQIWPMMTGLNNTNLGSSNFYPDLFPNPASAFSCWVVNYRTGNGYDAAYNPDMTNLFTPVEPGHAYTFVFSAGSQHPSGSSAINGVNTVCGWQGRQSQLGPTDVLATDGIDVIDAGTWRWSVNGYPDTGAPVSETTSNGSVAQMAFWTGSLTQDEMRVVSAQPFGEPLNVLDTQPSFHYYFKKGYKVNKRTALDGDEIAGNSYDNLGTIGNQNYAQFTFASGSNFDCIETQSYDRELEDYRDRV